MGRIVFFLLLGLGLYVAYRIWRAGRNATAAGRRSEVGRSEAMVRCHHCGLNLPESEAVTAGGRWFCGDAHRRLHHGD